MYPVGVINQRVYELLNRIEVLENKIKDLSINTEEKDLTPYTTVSINKNPIRISDIGTNGDGSIAWNDSELNIPPKYTKPPDPNKGYNKHFHTRYAGGALDIKAFEIIEYDIDWENSSSHSKHSQQFFGNTPNIKTTQNSNNEVKEKIGNIDFIFDADWELWGASAYEIDVKKCKFVIYDPDTGEIKLDENGEEMSSPIYNADDETKTNIVWDKTALCWRFYATYASTPIPPPAP